MTLPRQQLPRKHIQFNQDRSVMLMLPSSKMDPFTKGIDIHLATHPISPLCPIIALQLLVTQCPAPPNAHQEDQRTPPKSWYPNSRHSLWKGAAISTVMKGLSRDEIKLLGRWQSDAINIYINNLPQATQSKSQFMFPQPHHLTFHFSGPINLVLIAILAPPH